MGAVRPQFSVRGTQHHSDRIPQQDRKCPVEASPIEHSKIRTRLKAHDALGSAVFLSSLFSASFGSLHIRPFRDRIARSWPPSTCAPQPSPPPGGRVRSILREPSLPIFSATTRSTLTASRLTPRSIAFLPKQPCRVGPRKRRRDLCLPRKSHRSSPTKRCSWIATRKSLSLWT